MKFRRRFPKREYKPKSPIYLTLFLILIIGIIIFLKIFKGG